MNLDILEMFEILLFLTFGSKFSLFQEQHLVCLRLHFKEHIRILDPGGPIFIQFQSDQLISKNLIGSVGSEGLLRPSLAYPRADLTYLNQRGPCIEGGSPFGVEQCFAVSWVFICNCQVKRSSAFKVLPVQCMW